MTTQSTKELLQQTNMGLQMALYSFDQLLERVENPALKKLVEKSREDHIHFKESNQALLKNHGLEEEEPGAMAKGMAWMNTNMKLSMEDSDRVIAGIITDGCSMGSKNLYKYINQYADSDPAAAEAAKELIALEEGLEKDLRLYL